MDNPGDPSSTAAPNPCDGAAVDDTMRGLRIAAIFVILVAAMVGATLPVLLARQKLTHVPKLLFVCKFIGTGVIIATAFMHLLDPAIDNLGDQCVQDTWLGDYPWALCIAMMTAIIMFYVEYFVTSFDGAFEAGRPVGSDSTSDINEVMALKKPSTNNQRKGTIADGTPHDLENQGPLRDADSTAARPDNLSYPPGAQDHVAHAKDHQEGDSYGSMSSQLTAVFILEFGIVFHSVFIGLTLGTTSDLKVLLVVLVFHQMFEGLGLGSRLALAQWPSNKGYVPYLLCVGFALSTPIGIAVGIGAQPSNAATQKLVNGIFDSISAGILLYTGFVELLAHEFFLNPAMRRASVTLQVLACGCIAFGVAIMALLAKWA
ncbi:membrane zinc transporter [Moelleriella libera RCEF 2490]|uniref:Membrane zinc transporter n=1 Tax=Moelleriella libera RCEF 2490 TaxID=1081109 RepID=A0A167Y3F7_9HYPO|nr:membrane zinc transporter [Moelleriella libera RCEF 2490]